jgi:hypothetical protein
LVANADRLFPLNNWVLDQAFFATLLARPYEDVESFGDLILEAKGSLRLPFYSRGTLFDLVIDSGTRHLRTERDERVSTNEAGSDRMTDLEPFDMPFEQVASLSQKASTDVVTGALMKQSFALKLGPQGLAPYYAFMDVVQCLYGESVQKRITANLGRYLVHVMRASAISTHLVNPDSKTRDWLLITSNSVAVGTIAAAQVGNINSDNQLKSEAAMMTGDSMKVLAQNKVEAAKYKSIEEAQSEESKNWHNQTFQIVFSKIDAERTGQLENFENELLSTMESLQGK